MMRKCDSKWPVTHPSIRLVTDWSHTGPLLFTLFSMDHWSPHHGCWHKIYKVCLNRVIELPFQSQMKQMQSISIFYMHKICCVKAKLICHFGGFYIEAITLHSQKNIFAVSRRETISVVPVIIIIILLLWHKGNSFAYITVLHNGAWWTEGPYEKFQFYILPMKNLFLSIYNSWNLLDNSQRMT